ncbi:MAG: META domain-containing protein [Nocardioidaceae bacterium]
MTLRLALATAVVALPFLSGCGKDADTGAPAVEDLAGNVFVGTDVTGHDLVPGSSLRLEFDKGKLSAYVGCNRMSAGFSLDDGLLKVDPMSGTMMGCAQELTDQDTWLSEFLGAGPKIELDAGTLALASGEVVVRLAEESTVGDAASLEGTDWKLTTVIQGDSASSVPADTKAGIRIDGGSLLARTGCNNGRATVTVGDDALTVSPLASTKMACLAPYDEIEPAFLAVVQSNPTYQIEYDTLTLTSSNGSAGLVFRAAAPASLETPPSTEPTGTVT